MGIVGRKWRKAAWSERKYCISTALLVSSQVVHIFLRTNLFFLPLLRFCFARVHSNVVHVLYRVCSKIMQKISTLHFTSRDQYRLLYTALHINLFRLSWEKDNGRMSKRRKRKTRQIILNKFPFILCRPTFQKRHDLSKQFVQFGNLCPVSSPSTRTSSRTFENVAIQ